MCERIWDIHHNGEAHPHPHTGNNCHSFHLDQSAYSYQAFSGWIVSMQPHVVSAHSKERYFDNCSTM